MTGPLRPSTPVRAWVRPPTADFAQCLRGPGVPAPDVQLARREHQGYVAALRDAGVEVVELSPVPGLPDACFVEDAAVLLPSQVVLTRPGAPPRRAEVASLEGPLAEHLPLARLDAPATLDGGDVMRLGAQLWVGRSRRTNDEGIEQLRALAAARGLELVAVEVSRGLHLKSACTALDAATVLVDPNALDAAVFESHGVQVWPSPEPLGANVLAFADRVLVSSQAPVTAAWLRDRGSNVVEVAIGQFHRGDGALSCLSLRQAPTTTPSTPNGWVV